jgi:hypothetical protein
MSILTGYRGFEVSTSIRQSLMSPWWLLFSLLLANCTAVQSPDRLYEIKDEIASIKAGLPSEENALKYDSSIMKDERNRIITARKLAIDMYYTKYDAALSQEIQAAEFGAKAINIGLTTTSALIPVVHTKTMLDGIATGASGLDTSYNEKVLRSQLVANIQAAMRSARHDQAAVIYANMNCSIEKYNVAMALSDLEAYYRAGTVPSGLVKLTQTILKEEAASKEKADNKQTGSKSAALVNLQANANAWEAIRKTIDQNTTTDCEKVQQPSPQNSSQPRRQPQNRSPNQPPNRSPGR